MAKKERCRVAGCKDIVRAKRHGLCNAHHLRYLRHGDVGTTPILKRRSPREIPVYQPPTDKGNK